MMNTDTFLIDSFNAKHSQTIYACKRKATLIMSLLKKIDKSPSFLTINSSEAAISDIYSIFSPYHSRIHWIGVFGIYRLKNDLSWDYPLSRSLLLDILAYSDGYPSWENMQHHLSNPTNSFKTFALKYDHNLYDSSMGRCSAYVYWDDKNHKENGINLYNPSQEFGQFEIDYSWGYSGSSVRELSRALLYSIDPNLINYWDVLTEGFLPYFAQNKPEMLLTELEIRQFINHYKQNKGIALREELRNDKRQYALSDLDWSNAKPFTLNPLEDFVAS
ncbi:hypothetical protein LEWO105114_12235 [Legionella worsleiensis]|nr:Uncharacterised protein [Legionella worsleiensis]